MKKKKGLKIFLLFIILSVAVWYVGTFWLITTTTVIYSDKVKDEITIVQLTDLHGSNFGIENSTIIEQVRNAKPDIVCVTGDMYTYGDEKGEEIAFKLMKKLANEFDVYYVNGEHDLNMDFRERLSYENVNVMTFDEEIIKIKNSNIHIFGINSLSFSQTYDLENEFVKDNENFTLLLAHVSDLDVFEKFGIDLALVGDTHGGQVRIPFIGALINRGIWFPEIRGKGDVTHTDGLYTKGKTNMYVSSGLGNYPVPVRFMNMPEVAVIKIKPE